MTSGIVRPGTAALLLAVVILLWGVNWPVMKVGVMHMPPVTFAAVRVALGAAVMFALTAALGKLRLPRRGDWPVVLAVGLMQMGLFLALVNLALRHVDAGRSAILAYTTPLWVVPGAMLLLGERLTGRRLAGLTLGLAGVAAMFNPAALDWRDPAVLIGNGLLMLAALSWAAQIVYVRRHRWLGSPLELAPWQFLAASLLLAPLALVLEFGETIRWSGELALVLAYNGPIATAFCFWAVVTVNRALPAITTSLGTLGVPVVGLLASAATLGERISPTKLAGLILIGGGLVLVALGERTRPKSPT